MAVKLLSEWHDDDECGKDYFKAGTIFMNDNICTCGIKKHHYHCPYDGKVVQVG